MKVEIYKLQQADDHGGGDAERDLAWVGVGSYHETETT